MSIANKLQEEPVQKPYLFICLSFLGLFFAVSGCMTARAASFDCTQAQSNVEHLVCNSPKLSEADSKLDQDYKDALSKADKEQKQHLIVEQRHWLTHTRNVCETETCLKHAYWSRQAALETYFESRSPLYEKESDKAGAIKEVLATAPLYFRPGKIEVINQFCNQVFDDLKQMRGIRFIDPIVQTQSYEDPALDPWKKRCQSAPPFNFSFSCERNIEPHDADDVLEACNAGYGLPPFKIFELPPAGSSREKRYIFYNDEAYGWMNRDHIARHIGAGFAGFTQIHLSKCLSAKGNAWAPGEETVNPWVTTATGADAGQGDRNGKNYNSIVEYKNEYYFLVLNKPRDKFWLYVKPVERSQKWNCHWFPVKPKPSVVK